MVAAEEAYRGGDRHVCHTGCTGAVGAGEGGRGGSAVEAWLVGRMDGGLGRPERSGRR